MKNLTKQTLTNLARLKTSVISLDDSVFVKNGLLYRTGELKNCGGFVTVAYETDLPDCCIPFKEIRKIVDKLVNPIFEYSEEGGDWKLSIKDGNRKFRFNTHSLDEAYHFEIHRLSPDLTISNKVLAGFSKFTGDSEIRPALSLISIDSKGMCATDAHTLRFRKDITCDKQIQLSDSLYKFFGKNDEIEISVQEEDYILKSGDMYVIQRHQDMTYPNWPSVIPDYKDFNNIARMNVKELAEVLDLALTCASEQTYRVSFGQNLIYAENEDTGSQYEQTMPDSFTFPEYPISLNGVMLKNILSEIEGECVVETISPSKAAIINREFLQMPIMISDYELPSKMMPTQKVE